jgi:hypothetical protein
MEFKSVLKILAREGYPNPNLGNIFDAIDYYSENFLTDLVENLGEEGATEFVSKTLSRLSSGINSEIQIKISDIYGYPGSWVNLIIHNFFIDLDESEYDVMVNYSWGDNKFFLEDGTETTLDDMAGEVDMGGMGEWHDFLDDLLNSANGYIAERCAFGIWYQ